jgi:hypothetical protein
MTPFNVVMLGKSYMNPTLPAGIFGESLFGASLPAGVEPLTNPDGSAIRDTTGSALYTDDAGNTYNQNGEIRSTAAAAPRTWVDDLRDNFIKKTPDITDAALKILLKQQGISDTQANASVAKKGFSLSANMPVIVIGGVALLAILFMAGTRRRRA